MAILTPASPSEACRCGRLATKVHCIACGRYGVAYQHKLSQQSYRITADGAKEQVDVFRCQTCGTVFTDWQWKHECEAPRFETKSMKARRIEETVRVKYARELGDPKTRRQVFEKLFPYDAGGNLIKPPTPTVLVEPAVKPPVAMGDEERTNKGPSIFDLEEQNHEPTD